MKHQPAPVLDREALKALVDRWKQAGEVVVFTNGCFDLLHPGHLHVIREASQLGDRLVVALNTDASVSRLKGPHRPLLPFHIRAELVAALRWVDAVTGFDEDTPEALIRLLIPDVLVKGGDYRPEDVVGREWVEQNGGRVVVVPLREGFGTTRLIHERLVPRICHES